jgi:uncharacterized membrane protein YjfL (UPF0719 family)
MDYLQDLLNDLAAGLLYGLVGIVLLVLGYLLIDALTPGKLGKLLCEDRSRNAGVVVCSGLLSIGLIVSVAIVVSGGDLSHGLGEAGGFGLLGIVLLGVAFVVIDLITPGRLGDSVTREGHEPMAYVTAAALLSVGGIIAAAIS